MAEVSEREHHPIEGRHPLRFIGASLGFLKEWSGPIAFLIFLVTSLPFDVMEKYFGPIERKVSNARAAINGMVDLYVEKAKALSVADQTQAFSLNVLYNAKLLNYYSIYKEDIDEALDYISGSEIILVADVVSLNGNFDDARFYYQKIVSKGTIGNPWLATAYNGIGMNYASEDPAGGVAKAREYRLKYLDELFREKRPIGQARAAVALLDFALFEMQRGDWPCGKSLADLAVQQIKHFDPYNLQNMTLIASYQMQSGAIASRPRSAGYSCPSYSFN